MPSRLPNTLSSIVVDTDLADCGVIPFGDSITGEVFIPAGSTTTLLTWYAAKANDGTFLPAYNSSGVAITQAVAAEGAYPIPSDLAGARALKAKSNLANQVMDVSLKA